MAIAIEAQRVTKRYRGSANDAVRALTFSIREAEIVGLLGPNGAGKTTLIKLLCGVMPRTSGALKIFGADPSLQSVAVKSGIGVVHQQATLDMFLSAEDNLRVFAAFHGLRWADVREHVSLLLDTFELGSKRTTPVFTMSGGERRRVQVVRALMKRPKLLLLDEPSAGLDVLGRRNVWSLVRALRDGAGTTIVWTSHYTEELERNCDRVLVMNEGAVIRAGTPAELIAENSAPQLTMAFSRAPDLSAVAELAKHMSWQLVSNGPSAVLRGPCVRDSVGSVLAALGSDSGALTQLTLQSESLEDVFVGLLGSTSGTSA